MREDIDIAEPLDAMAGLLCCSYLAVFFDWLRMPWPCAQVVSTRGLLWALGVHRDGQGEVLGVWSAPVARSFPWQMVLADLKVRGVERIRFAVDSQSACIEGGLPVVPFCATGLPSIEQTLAVTVAQVAPRHRCAVELALRAVAGAGNGEAVGAALRAFERSRWGERYPQIVAQWLLALAQWAPLFALPASLRRVVVSGDRTAANLHRILARAIDRHGSFANQAEALDFVAEALLRAERSFDRVPAMAVTQPRIRRVGAGGGTPAFGMPRSASASGGWVPR